MANPPGSRHNLRETAVTLCGAAIGGVAAGWIAKVVITRTKLATIDNGPAIAITVGAVGGAVGAVGLGWLVQKVYHQLKLPTQIQGEYIQHPRHDDRCETVAILFGAAIGGVATGLATQAVHGPAIAISLGAVYGAVGGGCVAKNAYHCLTD